MHTGHKNAGSHFIFMDHIDIRTLEKALILLPELRSPTLSMYTTNTTLENHCYACQF